VTPKCFDRSAKRQRRLVPGREDPALFGSRFPSAAEDRSLVSVVPRRLVVCGTWCMTSRTSSGCSWSVTIGVDPRAFAAELHSHA
jgi:hypothetical protein